MANETQGATQEAEGGFWDRLVYRFWFLRGVVAAVSLAGLVPNFISMSRFEFLAFFHALVVNWNESLTRLLKFLAELGLPALSAVTFNTFLLLSISVIPSSVGCFLGMTRVSRWLAVFSGFYFLVISVIVLMSASVIVDPSAGSEMFPNIYLAYSMAGVVFLGGFALTCLLFPGFGLGVLSFVVFVVSMEALYFLAGDVLADFIRGLPEVVPLQ